MLRKNLLLLLFLPTLLLTCNKEEDLTVNSEPEPEIEEELPYPGVDQALWVYFERYEEEGRARGIDIDLRAKRITGVIQEISEDGVAGQCTYSSFRPNHIMIDQTFWNRASTRAREFVVFHELGHCDLGREHREASFANGTCQSIMRSGVGTCRDNYNSVTRPTYLNELFDTDFANQIQ